MTTFATGQKFMSFSYFLPKLQNQLTKMGTILVKSAFNALKLKFSKKGVQFSGTFFVIDIFWKLQFLKNLKHFFLKLCPYFVSCFWSFGKKYENDLRVIFDQWPKLSLGLDVQPEIPILKVIYYIVVLKEFIIA